VTALPTILSNVKIVPEHIWSHVTNPTAFTNPNPVGTGPFTRIARFTSQDYILGKNPYYWQPGKPAADGLHVPLFTGNDPANLALAHGEFDWESTFVPNVQRIYVNPDPVHRHYFLGNIQGANGLYFNDQVYPFRLAGFRKAISYAVDRRKIWLIGEYGYMPPSDAIGIAAVWPSWVDKSLMPQAKVLATYSPAKAKALLATQGFTWKGGQLYDPRGHKVAIQLSVPSGWTDYALDCQIMAREFQAIGIDASVKLMDLGSWTDKQNRGIFSAIIQAPPSGVTPYYYFNSYMSRPSYVPTGQDASLKGFNLERWWSPQATQLLAQFRQSTDSGAQHAAIDGLQRLQLDQLPWIPLMYSPYFYNYSTLRFTGWPTKNDNYAIGAPWQYPDDVKIMTSVVPVK
jgi:peptide/nickel transport system substrate-binding protein